MKQRQHQIRDISDMSCPNCHTFFDIAVTMDDQGNKTEWLQCLSCRYKIRLYNYPAFDSAANVHVNLMRNSQKIEMEVSP